MVAISPQDRYARVGSINTRYRMRGIGSPVVLVHGVGSSLEDWDHNFAPLAEHHCVYALDLVGNGRSDKPTAPYTLAYLSDFVRDFLRTQDLERVSLVGNSLGGTVVLDFVIRYPEQVERLVLVDPAGLGCEITQLFRLCTLPVLGKQLTKPSPNGSDQLQRSFYFDQSLVTPELVQFKYELSSQPGMQDAMLATLRANANLHGVKSSIVSGITGNLSRITAPTLVIWGREDRTIPVVQAEVARKGIPNVQVHIFDRCAHAPMIEKAEAFNNLLIKFLE
jgi:pimeloyl-ACP methyl ester carboxylesterase